jgi:hypothetical protein
MAGNPGHIYFGAQKQYDTAALRHIFGQSPNIHIEDAAPLWPKLCHEEKKHTFSTRDYNFLLG